MTIIPKATRPLDKSILFVEDTSPAERTTHKASCHCGTVKYDVTLKYPFPKYPVNNCNCSVCFQNGYLFVYPCRRDVVFKEGMLSSKLSEMDENQLMLEQDMRISALMNSTPKRNHINSARRVEAVS
jgi:hypothetical protein